MALLEQLRQIVDECVQPPWGAVVKDLMRESIFIRATPDNNIPLGQSKFGGTPDLPSGAEWPTSGKSQTPLEFIAQINCADLAEFHVRFPLPTEGILYFFYHFEADSLGAVIHAANSADLIRSAPPEFGKLNENPPFWKKIFARKKMRLYQPCKLNFSLDYTFPESSSIYLERAGFADQTRDAFCDDYIDRMLERKGQSEDGALNRLFGHPDTVQGQWLEHAVMDEPYPIKTPTEADLDRALEWKLLLQIDSDSAAEMMWGDLGRIYFYIHQDDLAAQRYDNARVAMDCY